MARGTFLQQKIYYFSPPAIKNLISSIYGWRQKKDRYGHYYDKHLQFLKKSQWFINEKLLEFQFENVKKFLVYVEVYSKYFQNIFKTYSFNPQTFHDFYDLRNIPILKKDTIREKISDLIPTTLSKAETRWSHTSGTTGKSLHFPISIECFQREYAFREVHYSWGGISTGNKIAVCAGHPVINPDAKRPPFWSYDYINNWLLLSSSHLTENNIKFYITELEKFNPDMIKGYPSSVYLLAIANKNLGYRIKTKAVFTASETLFDFQRKVIEESFCCKVYMWYGTGEMCGNIVECENGKYHIKLEHSYLEFLDDEDKPVNPGQEGRMICTAFGNTIMPFVRYDIGDIAIPSKEKKCSCGRGGFLVDKIIGRVEDYIITSDGRYLGRLDHLFKDTLGIKNAQIIQTNLDSILIKIVKYNNYSIEDEAKILKEAQFRLGSKIRIEFDYVDELIRTKNGKVRFIISEIENKQFLGKSLNTESLR